MENLSQLLTNLVMIALDLISLALVVGGVLIVCLAIAGMARNRTAAWDNILYIPIVLFLGALLLQYYPPLLMKSVRMGVEGSRGEAQLLRDEMQNWMPGQNMINGQQVTNPTAPAVVIDTSGPTTIQMSTPFPTAEIRPTILSTIPATPLPTIPSSTPTPVPLPTYSCFVNVNGYYMACPPTPQP